LSCPHTATGAPAAPAPAGLSRTPLHRRRRPRTRPPRSSPPGAAPRSPPTFRSGWRCCRPGVFQRGPSYVVTWRDRGKLRSRAFRTLTEAKRFKARTDAGDTRPDSREPFNAYAQRWLGAYAGRTARGITDNTRATYRDAITRFAVPIFGTTRIEHIDPPLVREYIADLAGKGMAPSSVRRHFAPVRALLATAYDDGLLTRNPAAGVRVIVRDTRPARPKRLTPEQTTALLERMPAKHADMTCFLAATGVRISEALGARWGDLGAALHGQPVFRVRRAATKTEPVSGATALPRSPRTWATPMAAHWR